MRAGCSPDEKTAKFQFSIRGAVFRVPAAPDSEVPSLALEMQPEWAGCVSNIVTN